MRNLKGHVKNSYRPYKQLYYTVLDALSIFAPFSACSEEKISWLNETCCTVVQDTFFENDDDIFYSLRGILENPHHDENY